ncbi:hypothetical protein QBC34DRAFT_152415 [Podospora aff. communis PSN243]|uniref:Uncharacterized protein n=1 Tax=Podospora aff. communis PSN243 TaxID=3040156 RepID=A0AAV9GF03_9PEZI|nr:hypothetical protein QBC34DRAFT_152415 [Podospora aff. communis PSN243]
MRYTMLRTRPPLQRDPAKSWRRVEAAVPLRPILPHAPSPLFMPRTSTHSGRVSPCLTDRRGGHPHAAAVSFDLQKRAVSPQCFARWKRRRAGEIVVLQKVTATAEWMTPDGNFVKRRLASQNRKPLARPRATSHLCSAPRFRSRRCTSPTGAKPRRTRRLAPPPPFDCAPRHPHYLSPCTPLTSALSTWTAAGLRGRPSSFERCAPATDE